MAESNSTVDSPLANTEVVLQPNALAQATPTDALPGAGKTVKQQTKNPSSTVTLRLIIRESAFKLTRRSMENILSIAKITILNELNRVARKSPKQEIRNGFSIHGSRPKALQKGDFLVYLFLAKETTDESSPKKAIDHVIDEAEKLVPEVASHRNDIKDNVSGGYGINVEKASFVPVDRQYKNSIASPGESADQRNQRYMILGYQVAALALHELGHAFGLDHTEPNNKTGIMDKEFKEPKEVDDIPRYNKKETEAILITLNHLP